MAGPSLTSASYAGPVALADELLRVSAHTKIMIWILSYFGSSSISGVFHVAFQESNRFSKLETAGPYEFFKDSCS